MDDAEVSAVSVEVEFQGEEKLMCDSDSQVDIVSVKR